MRDQNHYYIVRNTRFDHAMPEAGRLVHIVWSDMETTTEVWEDGVYSFDRSKVVLWPVTWSYPEENKKFEYTK